MATGAAENGIRRIVPALVRLASFVLVIAVL